MLLKLEVCGFTRTYNVVRLEGKHVCTLRRYIEVCDCACS